MYEKKNDYRKAANNSNTLEKSVGENDALALVCFGSCART